MKRSIRSFQLLIGLIIICSSLSLLPPAPKEKKEASAILAPAIQISLDDPSKRVQVAPGQPSVVTFSGRVTAQISWEPNVQKCIVYLIGSAGGWPVTLSPSAVVFSRQTRTTAQTFQVTVKVPPEQPYGQDGTLTVSGHWQYAPGVTGGNVQPTTGAIIIDQFYRYTLSVKKPYIQVKPGSTLNFDINLRNDGNGPDTMTVAIQNYKDLTKKDWVVQMGNPRIRVQAKQESIVTVSIATKQRVDVWVNEVTPIKIELSSVQAQELGELSLPLDYSLFVRERGVATPGFDPMFLILIIGTLAILFVNRERKRME